MAVVSTEVHGGVAVIRLDSPKTRNALSPAMMDALADALLAQEACETVGCMIVTGGPQVFAAGADIRWLAASAAEDMMWFGSGRWPDIRSIQTPVVAAVEGLALGGGCELALSCDFVIAGQGATLGLPEIGLGILPGAGGTQRVTRTAGRLRAMEMILLDRRLSAREAHEWGLVTRVAPDGEVLAAALEIAEKVAAQPRLAARLAKRAIRAAEELPLSAGLDYERRLFELALSTRDRAEGMAAFLEKRPPRWTPANEGREERS